MANELDRLKARHANAISRFADKNATGPYFEAVTQSADAVIARLESRLAECQERERKLREALDFYGLHREGCCKSDDGECQGCLPLSCCCGLSAALEVKK